MSKAADMMIARRADTRAKADFATWKMMAKLNGASSLPAEAQNFLDRYNALLKENSEADASDAIIRLIYRTYYEEMGGAGEPPDVKRKVASKPANGNVTAFKRPSPQRQSSPQRQRTNAGSQAKPRLPVALIFVCLVLIYTSFRYFFR